MAEGDVTFALGRLNRLLSMSLKVWERSACASRFNASSW